MKYIECAAVYRHNSEEKSLFLAGGITNYPQWQPIMVGLLRDTNLAVLNPRRRHFDVTDPGILYGNPSPENLLGGFILCWAFLKSQTLVVPLLLHAGGNACAFLANVAYSFWWQGRGL